MIIGTCSLCGGAVSVPDVWHGVIPPPATCEQCGATRAASGPVIPMIPPCPPARYDYVVSDGFYHIIPLKPIMGELSGETQGESVSEVAR